MNLLRFPLVRIAISFVFGILFAKTASPDFTWLSVLFLTVLLAVVFSYFIASVSKLALLIFGVLTTLLSFFSGAFAFSAADPAHDPRHFSQLMTTANEKCEVVAEITQRLKSTALADRYMAEIYAYNQKKSSGKILVNIKSCRWRIAVGTLLKISGTMALHRPPLNPGQFDYCKYLENQQVKAQLYTTPNQVQKGHCAKKSAGYFADGMRNKLLGSLEKAAFAKPELAVLSALILGQQQDIPENIRQDYQYAGAIHILSVSGLHVGLVLLLVNFLLKRLANTRINALIKLLITLVSLWGFGILAGLAPSVIRSVTMFSFVAVGMFLGRVTNIFHTLVVSLLLILLVRPYFLFDVGFQLSYTALFFIVWLQPLMAKTWTPGHKMAAYFWDILTVSFAAQIGTLPLCLYYFHQFPGLFFVTNLIVLPLLGWIMSIGILAMVLGVMGITWLPLLQLLEASIRFMDGCIAWVASFESFQFREIAFNQPMLLATYLLIGCFVFGWKKPIYRNIVAFLSAVIILQLTCLGSNYYHRQQQEFLVFNLKGKTMMVERKENAATVYTNARNAAHHILQNYLTAHFCRLEKQKNIGSQYYFKKHKILLVDAAGKYKIGQNPDVVILTGSPKINLELLLRYCRPKQVVADASNYSSYAKRWEMTCQKEKIPFHYTREKGFYKLD